MSTPSRIMGTTTRKQHESILFRCVSLIETIERNDGSGEICETFLINQINTILDIFSIDNENIQVICK